MTAATTTTADTAQTASPARAAALPALGAAALGLALIVMAGHLQAGPLHDAAHDVRHATGFPCH